MYSEKFKTLFVHIPKTGGQSIEHVFIAESGLTWDTRAPLLLRRKTKEEKGPNRLAHLFAREYVPFGYVTPEDFAASFKFAVVRNPYDRAISEYRYKIVDKPAARDLTFRDYVASLETGKLTRHDVPQSDFVLGESGAMMVDQVLRFENLAEDFADVSRRIFGRAIDLPYVNKSTGAVPADGADAGLRKMLHRFYERDFDLFKYPGGF
jgi:hypothetical protein